MSERNPQVNLTRPDQTRPNLGRAELTVVNFDGRSFVAHQYSQAPLQLHRPLYLDGEPFPTVFMKTPSAGLLGGDRHHLKLFTAERSTVKMLNQSATLVYPGASELEIEIRIERDGTVYFEPCPLILAKGASLQQTVRIEMGKESRLQYVDEWSAGRIAMDECFHFERFDNTIEIWIEGELKYRERFILTPGEEKPDHPLIAGRFTRFKSVFKFGSWPEDKNSDAPPAGAGAREGAAPKIGTPEVGTAGVGMPDNYIADGGMPDVTEPAFAGAESLSWRMQRPCGTVERFLSAPLAQTNID